MPTISVLINTLNEERDLSNAIASVRTWVDEIVVVDMKSDDRTLEVARAAGAKIFEHERCGHVGPARGFGISKCTGEWLLILDADEVVPPALSKQILDITAAPGADVYKLPFQNYFLGRAMEATGYGPSQDYHERLFRKGSIVAKGDVHDEFGASPGAKVADLTFDGANAVHHFSYTDASDFLERMNRYTTFEAERELRDGRGATNGMALRRALKAFRRRYYKMGGKKDGWQGFYLSVFYGCYALATHLKMREKMEGAGKDAVQAQYAKKAEEILAGYK